MEIDSELNEEKNENIQIYPPIIQGTVYPESKKFLSFFSKKINNKISSDNLDSISNRKSLDLIKEKEQNSNNLEEALALINKGIAQSKTKSKRSGDIKTALENFLRKSDLIEKIIKFFEEHNRDKSKQKTEGKNNVDEDKEKLTEIYINSIISKLADNVSIEKYNQNEFVVRMNEKGDNCYFLLSGILSVLKPVTYHIELTCDEYLQYVANLNKNKEYEIIDNIRQINRNYIDIGLTEYLENFLKSYFIIKLKKDIFHLFKKGKFTKEFIGNRLNLFNFTFSDFNIKSSAINLHIEQIIKGSSLKDKELRDYLDNILVPQKEYQILFNSNPNIFSEVKHKFTIIKYEDFLYLKPGSFFGESALEDSDSKRNASIRTEEDCVILSLHNDMYRALLYENNRKLKSFDVIFICKNFFFNDISTTIFNKNYYPFFKLLTQTKDDIIYKQNNKVNSVFFIKEGDLKLEINVSMTELYNLIKYYYDKLSNNSYIKLNQVELKEIKDKYLEDKLITDVRHQSQIMREKLNKKIKFELYTTNGCDTLGLEEYFLKDNFLCSCVVISKQAKIFEINCDLLNNIITNEKKIHFPYYNLIQSKLLTTIKRLHMIKINYINQLQYKIKENFFGTEVAQDNIIKGQTGSGKPYSRYLKKRHEPKSLNYFYKNGNNEEKKNQNFLSLKKATMKLNMSRKRNSTNNDMNFDNGKSLDNSSQEDLKNKTNKKFKNQKKKKISLNLDKYNFVNALFKQNPKGNTIFSSLSKNKKKEKDLKNDDDTSKRIMETTIIKIGKDSLSLKEIGNRIKSTESQKNTDLSIVKNFFNTTSFNSLTKSLSKQDKAINKTNNILSLKNHKNFFNQKESKSIETKLPRISTNQYNNKISNTKNSNNIYLKSKTYKPKIKDKKIKLKPLIIPIKKNSLSEYFKSLSNTKKDSFNVILTDQDNLVFK